MQTITAMQSQPVVQHANYLDVPNPQCWGPRKIADMELILVVRGPFEYEDSAGVTTIQRGEVLLIPPEVTHTFRRPAGASRRTMSCIHCELLPGARWADRDYRLDIPPQRVTRVGEDTLMYDLFRHVAREYPGRSRETPPLVASLVRSIWIRLADRWAGEPHSQHPPQLSPRMQAMTDFLRSRMADPISRQDLARRFRLTPQHVNHLFRAELDTTPTAYLNRQRCLQAEQMMKIDGLNVSQAAAAVGFADPYYFSKVFKRIMGTPPSRA